MKEYVFNICILISILNLYIFALQYVERQHEIRQQRQMRRAEKIEKQQVQEQRDRVRREDLTEKLGQTGGLWNTPDEVDHHIQNIPQKNVRTSLETQIRFRRFVLGCKNANQILSLSSGGKKHNIDTLVSNLKCAIRMAEDEREEVAAPVQGDNIVGPLDEELLAQQKIRFQDMLQKTVKTTKTVKNTKKLSSNIKDPEDLVGKRVCHLCREDNEDSWFDAFVSEVYVPRRGKNKGKYMYKLYYDNDDSDEPYLFPLLDDMKKGDLRITTPEGAWWVGKKIDQRFVMEDGEECWYTGKVLLFNQGDQTHTVQWDYEEPDVDDDDEDEDDTALRLSEEPLLADYAHNDVRLIR